ncbi:MAG: hypothetical protein ACJA2S_000426 [Cyclobacteriaceae bacterium]|jgi:hypothetical protein
MSTSIQPTRTSVVSSNFHVSNVKEKKNDLKGHSSAILINKKNKQAVATLITQTIKKSLDEEMIDLIQSYITVRLTSLIRNSFNVDKLLSIGSKSSDLVGFDFNTSSLFKDTVNSKIFVRGGSHNGYAILHVPAFVPEFKLGIPDEATNFKICTKLVAISDFEYSEEMKSYSPMNKESHAAYGTFETNMLPVLKMQTQPITSQICINRCEPLGQDVHTILVMAIKFYNHQKGKFTHLADKGTMKVMNVF